MSAGFGVQDSMDQPLEDRRLIVVLKAEPPPETADAKSSAAAGAGVAAASLLLGNWQYQVAKSLAKGTMGVIAAIKESAKSGAELSTISFQEARTLRFPPGHPVEGVVYVRHPVIADTYYIMSDFHRVAFEHKFSEAMLLLMSLGAKSLRVEHIAGWSRDFASTLNVSVPMKAAEVNAQASAKSDRAKSLLFEATLSGAHAPELPDGLAWYHHEPMWMAVATGRMKYGLGEFSLSVKYRDDFGINGELDAKIRGAGLKTGGSFQKHEATEWKIEGVFGDR